MLTILVCALLELLHETGGLAGSILTGVLIPAVGTAGTYVVVVILAIICLVIITGKSLLRGDAGQEQQSL